MIENWIFEIPIPWRIAFLNSSQPPLPALGRKKTAKGRGNHPPLEKGD